MTSTAIFVGIDIAQANFVVACRPDATSCTVTNDPAGVAATVDRVRGLANGHARRRWPQAGAAALAAARSSTPSACG